MKRAVLLIITLFVAALCGAQTPTDNERSSAPYGQTIMSRAQSPEPQAKASTLDIKQTSTLDAQLPASCARSLTLEECQKLARENYPLISQYDLIEKSSAYSVANARRNWLPRISLSAQATYQSEVMDLDLPDMMNSMLDYLGIGHEGLRKDQYKASIELQQPIWDGGLTRAQVRAARAERELRATNWEVDMYVLRERVNGVFFGLLLLQESLAQTDIYIGELNRNHDMVKVCVANGVAGGNDMDLLQAELLGARQQRSALASGQTAYRMMLGIITGTQITEQTILIKPDAGEIPSAAKFDRPELKLFEAQEKLMEARRMGVNAGVMPQIGAFFQGAYGNPGLNLFKDMQKNRWAPYFITGIRLQWNIGGLYTKKNSIRQIDLDYRQLDNQREAFLYNMRLKSTQENMAIEKMQKAIEYDAEIIILRETIRRRTESGVKNGTKHVNDLLHDINAENAARQNKTLHEAELLKNIYDLKYTVNK